MSWLPFNSVIPGNVILKSLEEKRRKVPKPILSEDQTNKINTLLLEAYQAKVPILMNFYINGLIYKIKGIILSINSIKQEVLVNKTTISFHQIVDLEIID